MAAGRADERVRRERMSVSFGHLVAAHNGTVAPGYSEAAMSDYMKNAELEIAVDVGVGHGSWTMWTCDLTKAYVAINGDYRS
jgi:glutamate N-acetyltransferase/amino-acid N-acetyltransferase